jgi:AcrR family transcriptional regulator
MRKQLTADQLDAFRTRLVEAAEGLFAKHGVSGVTMRQIAGVLGYSQTAAYRYFSDKEEILAAVRATALNRFCDRLEQAFDPLCGARENARNVGNAFLDFALTDPDSYRFIFDAGQPVRVDIPGLCDVAKRFNATMVTYVQALIDEGLIAGDAQAIGYSFCVAAHGIVMMHFSGIIRTVRERDELHRKTMRMIYLGAKRPDAERKSSKTNRLSAIKPRKPSKT